MISFGQLQWFHVQAISDHGNQYQTPPDNQRSPMNDMTNYHAGPHVQHEASASRKQSFSSDCSDVTSAVFAALHPIADDIGYHDSTPSDYRSSCLHSQTPPLTSQLRLPSIRTSHVAANVMSEELDLGYSSFSDAAFLPEVADLTNVSSDSDDLFDVISPSFDDMIDDVLCDIDRQQEQYRAHVDLHLPETKENPLLSVSPSLPQDMSLYPRQTYQPDVQPLSPYTTYNPSSVTSPPLLPTVNTDNLAIFCGVCGKSFQTRAALKMHTTTHHGTRPHSCPYCNKSFTQKSTLRTHIRVHTGEKPYTCDHCTRAFSDYSTYRKHVRIHTGERPYVCDVCKKGFTQSGNMLRHREVHFKKQKK
ncbi:zinc finger protein 629-like [Mya arenaria]|uniref:zinc finger protein 629-like n=1 Tax=Mya arenaria TaxID=6604 RepID=UPI0022E3636F|nr:zinc finger protein 629-like [Mya arenaria]